MCCSVPSCKRNFIYHATITNLDFTVKMGFDAPNASIMENNSQALQGFIVSWLR